MKKITRRSFLMLTGALLAGTALTACGAKQPADILYDSGSMSLPASALPSASPAATAAAASADKWDEAGFTDALNGCIGWGGDAGSSLKSVIAACGLLDWGEDNTASDIGADALGQSAKTWLEGLSADDRAAFGDNWTGISTNAQNMLIDPDGMSGLLSDAGNPNKHSRYTSGNWSVIQTAIDNAMAG